MLVKTCALSSVVMLLTEILLIMIRVIGEFCTCICGEVYYSTETTVPIHDFVIFLFVRELMSDGSLCLRILYKVSWE